MEEKMPTLSIIVPVYRAELFLHQCIDSILNQTFQDFELILVDDGSPDSCPRICDEYIEKDNIVKVLHKTNGGIVSARNSGLRVSCGDFIGYVDSDDWIEPDMYEKMCNAAIRYNADIVICDIIHNYENKEIRTCQSYPAGLYLKNDLIERVYPNMLYNGNWLGRGLHPALCIKLFKRNILLNNAYTVDERIQIGEDMACSYPCILDANRIYILENQYLYHYRQLQSSITASYKKDFFVNSLFLYHSLKENCDKKNVYDMKLQILGNLLYFALASIDNEFIGSSDSVTQKSDKMRMIKEISNQDDVADALIRIDSRNYSLKNRMYIFLLKRNMHKTLYYLVYWISKMRNS